MRKPAIFKSATMLFVLWLALFAVDAYAAINNTGLLNNVLTQYQTTASTWNSVITARASWLFWVLATMSMVWTFGMMALRKADIAEFFAEFIRFIVFTGFFWWLLTNGPNFATDIMNSLRTIAGNASGLGPTLSPSGIVDIGFDIFFKVLNQSSLWSPVDSAVGIIISLIVLVVLALIGVNMLILLVSGWILAYAGVFFLGFGGSRWTSEMAIGYFKTVLNVAAQLFTMVLLVGIGKSFVDQYYANMSAGISLNELGVMLVVAVVLLALVNKVPPLIGGLAGGHTQSINQGFGAGAALGAAAMGAAAAATAGAAMVAAGANVAGGAQALMAAFSKANASESGGGGGSSGTGDLMTAAGGVGSGGDTSGGGSALASAMGGDFGGGGDFGAGSSSGSSDGGSSSSTESGGASSGGASGAGDAGGAPGEVKSGGAMAAVGAAASAAGSMAAKAGRIAAGTAGNLAQGSWDVAKAKAGSMVDSAMERIGETTGGKIASAINARADAESNSSNSSATFDDNSLSAGSEKSPDAASEVAAFVGMNTQLNN